MAPIPTDNYPLLHIERISQYVALPPASLHNALPAICAEIFSPLLLGYYAPVKGIVLAYEDVVLSDLPPRSHIEVESEDDRAQGTAEEENDGIVLARQIDEYAAPFLWATASLLVWRPQTHTPIPATLTHSSATHITLSHLNTFPISVLKDQLPADWEWHQESRNAKEKGWDGRIADLGGWWVDGELNQVDVGTTLSVWIRNWEARGIGEEGGKGKGGRGFLGIVGSLLRPEEGSRESRQSTKGKGVARTMERASVQNGEAVEVD
ncbi:hypothetical protein K458DRAFT_312656 [Lentithecium fluviatile CBS 122367]|uniref:DNA-directed RNA polymerase I subunit RPA43 n=1 Tax=Lentithecium fluviatile CBS 122367 TaxID=1168545 RepID=A0A6G1IPU4_9PLEO|nr:hypothetical protein K458DRAFT_312656 [Lentithecium fluviatile CBS 122367]